MQYYSQDMRTATYARRTQEAASKTPKALAVNPNKTGRSAGGLLGRARCLFLQLSRRIKGSKRDQLKTHEMSLAQRQFFEHLVRGRGVRDVQYERHAGASLKRVPLVDLAVQIELYSLAHFRRQDRACGSRIDAGIDGSDGKDSRGGRWRTCGLCVSAA